MRVPREHPRLVRKPRPCLGGSWLTASGCSSDRVDTFAARVETRAVLARRQHTRASIRLARRLEPPKGVDNLRKAGIHRGRMPGARAARVAPSLARAARVPRRPIASRVDDEVRRPARHLHKVLLQRLHIAELRRSAAANPHQITWLPQHAQRTRVSLAESRHSGDKAAAQLCGVRLWCNRTRPARRATHSPGACF